jgi:hypothetical protein
MFDYFNHIKKRQKVVNFRTKMVFCGKRRVITERSSWLLSEITSNYVFKEHLFTIQKINR